tara:strand:+ start:944 stop:1981 length:1038 start_codon:yes stop_codon:yes gene_type:complete
MSGPSDAQKAVEKFKQGLEGLENAEMNALVQAYRPVQQGIDKETIKITTQAARQGLKPWQVMRLTTMDQLRAQIVGDIKLFSDIAAAQITQGQAAAVLLSEQAAFSTMAAGLPPGVTPDMLANVGVEWNRLPREALGNFVGIAGDGAPVGNLLAEMGPQTAQVVRSSMLEGIGLGYSPRKTARNVQNASGMQLSKALAIARTETNRSFHEASRLQYASNPNLVKGYKRLSAKDDRVCMACIALDGTLYEVEEPLNSHVNCRCAMVPETLTYADLGLDVPMPPEPENGKDWFNKQSTSTQKTMMKNPARYEAFKSGKINFNDLVKITDDPVWGKSASVAPLKDLSL